MKISTVLFATTFLGLTQDLAGSPVGAWPWAMEATATKWLSIDRSRFPLTAERSRAILQSPEARDYLAPLRNRSRAP
jgi:hypothetical protein